MSDCSDMEYSSDNECEYDDYYNTGLLMIFQNILIGTTISLPRFAMDHIAINLFGIVLVFLFNFLVLNGKRVQQHKYKHT